jgi:hypothetical protein
MIAVVIAAIVMLTISALLYSTYKNWFESKSVKALQEDMDLASFTVKSVLEEANWGAGFDDAITENRTKIRISYTEDEEVLWEKEFYQDDNELKLVDLDTGDDYAVIKTLDNIAFYESDDRFPDEDDYRNGLYNTLFVEITVTNAERTRTLENQFFVRLRN